MARPVLPFARAVTRETDACTRWLGCWLRAPEQILNGEANISSDLPKQRWGNIPCAVKRNSRVSAIIMAELLV